MHDNKIAPWAAEGDDDLSTYKFNTILKELTVKISTTPNKEDKLVKLKMGKKSRGSNIFKITNNEKSAERGFRKEYAPNITQIGFNEGNGRNNREFYMKHLQIQKPRHSMFLRRPAKYYIDEDQLLMNYPLKQIERETKKQQNKSTDKALGYKQFPGHQIESKINRFLPKKLKTQGIEEEMANLTSYKRTIESFQRRYKPQTTISLQRKIFLLKQGTLSKQEHSTPKQLKKKQRRSFQGRSSGKFKKF